MRTVYHFSGVYQKQAGSINHVDGIASMEHPVTDLEGYFELKRLIVKELFLEVASNQLTIQSLSILHQYEEGPQ
jgi:hypothetical protein